MYKSIKKIGGTSCKKMHFIIHHSTNANTTHAESNGFIGKLVGIVKWIGALYSTSSLSTINFMPSIQKKGHWKMRMNSTKSDFSLNAIDFGRR